MHLIMHLITACIFLSGNGCFAFWSFSGDIMDNFSCFKYRCLPWPCCPVEWCDTVDYEDVNGFEVRCSTDYADEGCVEQESHSANVPRLTTSSEKPIAFKTATEEVSKPGNSLGTSNPAKFASPALDEENFDYPSAGESRIEDFQPEIETYGGQPKNPEKTTEIITTAIPNEAETAGTLSTNPHENETEINETTDITLVNNTGIKVENCNSTNYNETETISSEHVVIENEEESVENCNTTVSCTTDAVMQIVIYNETSSTVEIETAAAPKAADLRQVPNIAIQNEMSTGDEQETATTFAYAADNTEVSRSTHIEASTGDLKDTTVSNAEISNTAAHDENATYEEEITTVLYTTDAKEISNSIMPHVAEPVELENSAAPNAADEISTGELVITTLPYAEEIPNTIIQYETEDETEVSEEVDTAAPDAADMIRIPNTAPQNDIAEGNTFTYAADDVEVSNSTVPIEAVTGEKEGSTTDYYASDDMEVSNSIVPIEAVTGEKEGSTTKELGTTDSASDDKEISNKAFQNEVTTVPYAADNMEISNNTVPIETAAVELDNTTVEDATEAILEVPVINELRYYNWNMTSHADLENKNTSVQSENETVAANGAVNEMDITNTAVPNATLELSSYDEVELNETYSNLTNSSSDAADFILLEHSTILPNISDENVTSGEMCHHFTTAPSLVSCTDNKYRTIDGTCNNPEKPALGSSGTRFQRITPQYYDDGLHAPRNKSKDGTGLPNARTVIELVNKQDQDRVNNTVNLMFVVWGQYIAYDMIKTHPVTDSESINCCSKIKDVENCLEINVSSDDRFYSKHNVTCLNFVRSYAELVEENGYYEQMNAATTYLDGSAVYGSLQSEIDLLRQHSHGKLISTKDRQKGETIQIMDNDFCRGFSTFPVCIVSGDSRVNQHGALSMVHFIFHREHNRIAGKFRELNPHWDDDDIFQEIRKIIGAIIQHITYNEYLPILLDKRTRAHYKLKLKKAGTFSYDYDCNVDPTIANEFSTAAFRFGQTQVTKNWIYSDSKLEGFRDTYNPARSFKKGQSFFNYLRYQLVMQPNCKKPNFMTHELTDHLFEEYPRKYGQDLASLNIQRGRDHGIAPYSIVRKHYNLTEPKSFDDLSDLMDEKIIKRLKRSYSNVEDIDLFVGGYLEKPLTDGHLGQTFTAIIADQFRRLREGDHFWYELGNRTSSFTIEQLDSIRKVTLTSLLCAPGERTAKLAMRVPCPKNPIVSCDQVDVLDLSPWRENVNNSAHWQG